MFNFNTTPHHAALDERIAELLVALKDLAGESEEYNKTAANLVKLMELRNQILKTGNESDKIETDRTKSDNDYDSAQEEIRINQRKIDLDEARFAAEKEKENSWKPSPDAVVGAAASVLGILLVLNYEKLNVITSKAVGFIGKLKS